MEFTDNSFELVGASYRTHTPVIHRRTGWRKLTGKPLLSACLLLLIVLGCMFSEVIVNHNPEEFYLANLNEAPNSEFYFGTDSLGRDIFSNIWFGGRVSLLIGFLSTGLIAICGISYGCIGGMANARIDDLMMRLIELIHSIPSLLMVLLIVSIMGKQNIVSIAFVIGLTGWFALARIVRSEVRQIRNSEYVLAARCMGGNLPYIIWRHLIPNFVSAIMFVVISSVSTCMGMEATLSFLGLGLPVDITSWGSMLALADKALLLNTWWVIIIPGLFLVVTLLCITNIAYYFRREISPGQSKL